jgi:SAM-dependent methyltransferase
VEYERDTKNAYRNKEKAKTYLDQYTKGTRWARFTMWRQRGLIERILDRCDLTASDRLLDIPCGTGLIGRILLNNPARVIGSDISIEMMDLARSEYGENRFHGFVQADITATPFVRESFACVVVLALMHRLHERLRREVLSEVASLSSRYVIMSYSVDSRSQRVKQRVLKTLRPSHVPAPSSVPLPEILREIGSHGFTVLSISHIAHFLSAKVVLLLEKNAQRDLSDGGHQLG